MYPDLTDAEGARSPRKEGTHMLKDQLQTVPVPTLRRLPSYLQFLRRLQATGRDVVSCTHIADDLHLDPTQVRKDLQTTGIVGKPRVGYYLPALIEAIEGLLGWNNTTEAFLVGVGSLGTALMGYGGFKDSGLEVLAGFDVDPAKVGTTVHGKQVLHVDKLPDLAARMHIHLGIITTPAEYAQDIAQLMVLSGIRGIWNFAPATLEVPEGIILENVTLAASLAVLSSKLTAMLRAEEQGGATNASTTVR